MKSRPLADPHFAAASVSPPAAADATQVRGKPARDHQCVAPWTLHPHPTLGLQSDGAALVVDFEQLTLVNQQRGSVHRKTKPRKQQTASSSGIQHPSPPAPSSAGGNYSNSHDQKAGQQGDEAKRIAAKQKREKQKAKRARKRAAIDSSTHPSVPPHPEHGMSHSGSTSLPPIIWDGGGNPGNHPTVAAIQPSQPTHRPKSSQRGKPSQAAANVTGANSVTHIGNPSRPDASVSQRHTGKSESSQPNRMPKHNQPPSITLAQANGPNTEIHPQQHSKKSKGKNPMSSGPPGQSGSNSRHHTDLYLDTMHLRQRNSSHSSSATSSPKQSSDLFNFALLSNPSKGARLNKTPLPPFLKSSRAPIVFNGSEWDLNFEDGVSPSSQGGRDPRSRNLSFAQTETLLRSLQYRYAPTTYRLYSPINAATHAQGEDMVTENENLVDRGALEQEDKKVATPPKQRRSSAQVKGTPKPTSRTTDSTPAKEQRLYHPSPRTPPKGHSNERKRFDNSLYAEYLDDLEIQAGLASGLFKSGTFRVNKANRYDAYIRIGDSGDDDVFVHGFMHQNRCFDGDRVVIQLLEGDELAHEQEYVKSLRDKKRTDGDVRQKRVEQSFADWTSPTRGDVEDTEEAKEHVETRTFAKVVGILERNSNSVFIGKLTMTDGSLGFFNPLDRKAPQFVARRTDITNHYVKNPHEIQNQLLQLTFDCWPAKARRPYGFVGKPIGEQGKIDVESAAILLDAGITWSDDFPQEALDCLPRDLPWSVPVEEYSRRRDLREEVIFSIDPPTARDLDDALSIKALPDGCWEVGVHIADVSHFVTEDSALDHEARNRATTVYLVQRAIPMLPRLLCEELCSLNPGVERLAFSVIWKFDSQANILGEPWFGKTVIKSCVKFSYDHAQALIDGYNAGTPLSPETVFSHLPAAELYCGADLSTIQQATLKLYEFSLLMRKRRFDSGALTIHSVKLWFAMDEDGMPKAAGPYQLKDSNRLIEEYMLLANMAVAKKIVTSFPEAALLRRHAAPLIKGLKEFAEMAANLGFTIDYSSSQALQQSLDAIPKAEGDFLRLMCIKPMRRAVYFSTGSIDFADYRHYALNCPLYTHFTSPIRRYCDLVVHRQLQCILEAERAGGVVELEEGELPCNFSNDQTIQIANQCNNRKDSAKTAQDASSLLYLAVYLERLIALNPDSMANVEEGVVIALGSRSYDVFVPKYGLEKRVWIEDAMEDGSVVACKLGQDARTLVVQWKRETGDLTLDDCVAGSVHRQLENDQATVTIEETVEVIDGDEDGNDEEWEDVEDEEVNTQAAPAPHPSIRIQYVRVFDRVRVRILPDRTKTPPEFKFRALYPGKGIGKGGQAGAEDLSGVGEISCPGIEDESH